MKNIIDAFTSRLDTADKRISELSILTESLKIDSKKLRLKTKPSQGLWDNHKRSNIGAMAKRIGRKRAMAKSETKNIEL